MSAPEEGVVPQRRSAEVLFVGTAALGIGLAAALTGTAVLLVGMTLVVAAFVFVYPREAALPIALLTPVANIAVLEVPGVIDIRVHQLMWLTLIASLLVRALVRRPLPIVTPPRWLTFSLLGLSAWQLVSAVVNGGGVRALVEVAQIGYFSVILWLLAALVPTVPPERRAAILRAVGAVWVVLLVASIAYFGLRLDWPVETTYRLGSGLSFKAMGQKVTETGLSELDVVRMGMFGHPAVSTASILAGVPAAMLALALGLRRGTDRTLAWLLFGLTCVVLLLTFSRAGWLFGVLAIVAILWRRGKGESLWAFLVLAAIGLMLLAVPQVSARVQDFSDPDEGSTKSHIKLWTRAIEYANAQPVFGGGPYSYSQRSINRETGEALPVHNFVLEAAAETGWVGAALTVAFVLALLVWGWRRLSTGPPERFALWAGLLVTVLMALTMNGYREDALWAWGGLMVAVAAGERLRSEPAGRRA